ncbi:hypothetical protein B0T14DRAFT_529170 [Immersiella caudata]|uniref:Uncharacterized protein n=1 Tax=Immersiella caudata TaxID=314043 RepID=A0AA39T1B1_9PEZI|nr:hypothetical protein B0T14DRAFT_529170 [Immersiella caudata]
MKRVVKAALLFAEYTLACKPESPRSPRMASGFDDIAPSHNLTWAPCFDSFTCAKLEVPLDYSNTTLGTTFVSLIKLAGKNATIDSPSIILIPGGPGGSGVDLLLTYQATVGQFLGEQYNFVSFDPRGVNNSGLASFDCFSGNKQARSAFNQLHRTGTTNTSTTSLAEQYYTSSIYGEWCNQAVENGNPHAYYVTTASVAQDLLTFIEAEAQSAGHTPSEAKLWCYGISYGTLIGTTFASMFPNRVGRMVLDGVINAEQYYTNDWRDNLEQADEAMGMFSTLCHSAGPERCSFWGATPGDITARLGAIVGGIQGHPVPVSAVQGGGLPTLVTAADLKAFFLNAVSIPTVLFPVMADVLRQVEVGDVSALVGMFDGWDVVSDAGLRVQCADAFGRNKLTTLDKFRSFVEYTASKSKYIGDVYPMYVEQILCRSVEPRLPGSHGIEDAIGGSQPLEPTDFPILFTSNTIDPITPLISARTMSTRFPGSIILQQEAIGHTVVNQGGSVCYFGYIQAYFQGVVPEKDIICPQQHVPFIDSPGLA